MVVRGWVRPRWLPGIQLMNNSSFGRMTSLVVCHWWQIHNSAFPVCFIAGSDYVTRGLDAHGMGSRSGDVCDWEATP
jgi:hypothetical protein